MGKVATGYFKKIKEVEELVDTVLTESQAFDDFLDRYKKTCGEDGINNTRAMANKIRDALIIRTLRNTELITSHNALIEPSMDTIEKLLNDDLRHWCWEYGWHNINSLGI